MADRLQFRGNPGYEIPAVELADREIMFDLTRDTLVIGQNKTYLLTEGTGYTKQEVNDLLDNIDSGGGGGSNVDLSNVLKFGVNISDTVTNLYSPTSDKKIEFDQKNSKIIADAYVFPESGYDSGIYTAGDNQIDIRTVGTDKIQVQASRTVFPAPIVDRGGGEVSHNYVNAKIYGVRGDGITDDSPEIQLAFDETEEGGALLFPPGTYILRSTVSTNKSLHIIATGAKFIIDAPVEGFVFDACDDAIQVDVFENYALGSTSLRINKKDDKGRDVSSLFKEAQLFKIVSKAVDYGNRDAGSRPEQYRSGEWTYAYSLTETSGFCELLLENPLRYTKGVSFVDDPDGDEQYINSYNKNFISDSDRQSYNLYPKILMLSGVTMSWIGGEIEYTRGKAAFNNGSKALWRNTCLTINGYTAPTVEQLKINYGYGPGILIDGSVHAKVSNCLIQNLLNNTSRGNYGYGIIEGGTFMGNVSQCTFINTRHGYTTGANSFIWNDDDDSSVSRFKKDRLQGGKTQSSVIADCHGTGPKNAPFDTHMDAEDIIFNDCISEGGFCGFAIRGRGILLNNCKAINHERPYLIFTEYQKGDPDDDLFTANKLAGATTAALSNCVAECVNGLPIEIQSAKHVYLSNLVIRNNNHQMIANGGSNVVFSGVHNYKVTDYDGRVPIIGAPAYNSDGDYRNAVFTTVAGGPTFNPYWRTNNKFESNCVVEVDAAKALPVANSSSANLAAFKGIRTYYDANLPEGSGPGQKDHPSNKLLTYMDINGQVRVRLGPAFYYLTTAYGWITGSGTEDGLLSYELVDANGDPVSGDNSAFTTGLYGHEINAESTDGKIYYHHASLKPKSNPLDKAYQDEFTSNGGDRIIYPYVSLAHLMDIPNAYIKQTIRLNKVGGSGTPTIKVRIGGNVVQIHEGTMSGLFAEVEVIVYCDGPASNNTTIFNNMRVYLKYTNGDNVHTSYHEMENDFDRTKGYVTDLRISSNNGCRVQVAQIELLASAIASYKIFEEEQDRIG